MPFITIPESPLKPQQKDLQLFYRDYGGGVPLVFLHGGWGYEVYPFDKQIAAFAEDFRILIPDRTGYGQSPHLDAMSADFHHHAAVEMLRFLDALHLERVFLWGHSDGAVIATKMALLAPTRFFGVIFEAFHFYKVKPRSREFFETMMQDPAQLGERVTQVLAAAHGEDYWQQLIQLNGMAWLQISDQSQHEKADLYDGQLSQLQTRAVFLHGKQDPRTEADELQQVQQQLPDAPIHLLDEGKHSPHSETPTAAETINLARAFLKSVTLK
ncbi:MAG: alpha/beta hydrolase [Acidobacteria bacterium]|nr:alpha/beta hydrolase [Acidobacteriota bacterium]